MPIDVRSLLPLLFALAPFVYSNDHSNIRAYEVLGVGILFGGIALASPIRKFKDVDWLLVFSFCAVIIFQQAFVPQGSLLFGVQYAVVLIAAFVPSWLVRAVAWRPVDFEEGWDRAIALASAILVVNLVGSRLFGFGEIKSGAEGGRYFGFLGDSISPVIIFPLLYYLFRRQYAWVATLALGMALTGGKAAFIMLAAALAIWAVRGAPWSVRILSVPFMAFAGAFASPAAGAFFGSQLVQYSWNTRLLSYEIGWNIFLQHPWFGVGINQSMKGLAHQADALAASQELTRYWIVTQIHNAFIRTMAETGLAGLIVLLALCVLLLHRAFSGLERAQSAPPSKIRALVLAGSVWTIAFITSYQSVGWFEHGHPQLAWLLLISSVSYAASKLYAPASALRPAPAWRERIAMRRSA